MKVLVLLGGSSNEREVSIRSGENISSALKAAGHEVYDYDPGRGLEGVASYVRSVDCVFPILHGKEGEDGHIQAELERLGFKYLGATPIVAKNCFNKQSFKNRLAELDVPTPRWDVVSKDSIKSSDLTRAPYVLKPIEGGSSIDTQIIRDIAQPHSDEVFGRYDQMLLEELIQGPEITVAVLDKKSLPVVEIIPPSGQEFDYDNKYNGQSQEISPPKNIDPVIQKTAQQLSEKIHEAFGVRHLSRTDFMVDSQGQLYAIDLNIMPGLTAQSLYPKAALAAGMSLPELVDEFLKLATE